MTSEPTYTASKERMVSELIFSSQHTPQISKTALKVQWSLRFAFSYVQPITQRYRQKKNRRKASATIQSPQNIAIRVPQLSITASKVQHPLRFAFSYVQPITQHYKWVKSSLQAVHSPQKIWMIPIYKRTV